MWSQILRVGTVVAETAGSVVGVRAGTEEPRFEAVERIGDIQIRRYGERVVAETVVEGSDEQARSDGFRRLAGYIFGGNIKAASPESATRRSESIAMTAPVAQTSEGPARWRIQFFMPSRYRLEDLPKPKDAAVHLGTVPAATYAVLVFAGAYGGGAMKAKQSELLAGLAGSRWRPDGEVDNWFYDPPWTIPSLRRNEVAVVVTRSESSPR